MSQLQLDHGQPVTASTIVRLDEHGVERSRKRSTPCGCIECRHLLHPVVYEIDGRGILLCPDHVKGELARRERIRHRSGIA